jgi:hypothetical protein
MPRNVAQLDGTLLALYLPEVFELTAEFARQWTVGVELRITFTRWKS